MAAKLRPVPPSSVEVNGYTFTVTVGTEAFYREWAQMAEDGDHVERGATLAGFTIRSKALAIYIQDGLPLRVEQETLTHELMHAGYYTVGSPLGWADLAPEDETDREMSIEETVIRFTSPMFLRLLRDNPDLVAYLTAS